MRSCCAPAEVVGRDVVKLESLEAGDLALMLGAATFLEPLERLTVAGRPVQGLSAIRHLELAAVKVVTAGTVILLGPLQVRLEREQVGRAAWKPCRVELSGASAGDPVLGCYKLRLAATMGCHRSREFLLGEVLLALAQVANTFEAEPE
jgi:hypothetical protein